MGKVTGTWLTGSHSGRVSKHDGIYTRVNKKTGNCTSAKLCNPNHAYNDVQRAYWKSFGMLNAVLHAWIKEQKQHPTEAYEKLMKQYNRQTRYATLRGMMVGLKIATAVDDHTVRITVDDQVFEVKSRG